jgi:hypothetical protein
MGKTKAVKKSFSETTKEGLIVVRKRLIEKEKRNNGYLVIADKQGKVKRVSASEL